MQLSQGLLYIFEDRNWLKKILVGAAVTSVPFAESITNGYQMQVIQNIKHGNPQPLPEWENVGEMFKKGFNLWLAVNSFYIPSLILSVLGLFVGLPWLATVLTLLFAQSRGEGMQIRIGVWILSLVISGLLTLCTVALPIAFVLVPAMALRCAETGSFFSTLNLFASAKFVFRHLGNYVLSRIGVFALITILGIIGSTFSGLTFWTLIGGIVGWVIIGIGRFTGRLMWAYYLSQMRLKESFHI